MAFSKEELVQKLAEALPKFIEAAHQEAIYFRARGWFEHANWAEERAHQLENYNWPIWGEYPGLESAVLDEIRRMHGKPLQARST